MAILSYESSAGRTLIARKLFRTAVTRGLYPVQLACFDVEKPDLMNRVECKGMISEDIYAPRPVIDILKCRYCGVCSGYCPEKAILFNRFVPSVTLIVSRCFACTNCLKGCSHSGIKMQQTLSGTIFQGRLHQHYFISGQIAGTSEFKLPLISALIERLNPEATVICDFEPGTDNTVRLGIAKVDVAVIVLNPGPEWERNLDVMLGLTEISSIPVGVILNKVNHATDIVSQVKAACTIRAIPLLGIMKQDKSFEHDEHYYNSVMTEKEEQLFSLIWKRLAKLFPANSLIQKDTLL